MAHNEGAPGPGAAPGRTLHYDRVRPQAAQADLTAVARYMFWLMFRNVASDGLVFNDPVNAGVDSRPGCVLASPSWENAATRVTQDYVYHWTRDAAIVAIELQTIALLQMYSLLDSPTRATAAQVIINNLGFLQDAYQGSTVNLWEEEFGESFFARSVQLKCFTQVAANTIGIPVPRWLPAAIAWLDTALEQHWSGSAYKSMLPVPADFRAPYDPNIDIVQAAIYGAIPVTDDKLLATAAQLRDQWADPASTYFYPINGDDAARRMGPLLGRYPGDVYDGDTDALTGDHPWALTTANFAELYYRLASSVSLSRTVPSTALAAPFLAQAGISCATTAADAVTALRAAGDAMLQAIVFHSDHLELSEQFDAVTGYEKSVSDLSWSYAAFLSASRARGAL